MREERRGKWSFYSLDREAAGELLGEAADRLLSGAEKRSVVGELLLRRGTGPGSCSSAPTTLHARRWRRGCCRHLAGDRFEAMSAGTEATHVRPLAIRAMDEIGVDISGQESKTLERYLDEPFDYVITVCDEANEACPFFPGAPSRLHWSFEDPSKAEGSEEERLAVFRSVRDRIRDRVQAELVNGGG